MAWRPDGQVLASYGAAARSGDPATIKLWDLPSGRLRRTVRDPCILPWSLAWSPDGRLLASGSACQELVLRDAATAEPLHRLPQAGHEGVWRPDSQVVASYRGNRIMFWDADTGLLTKTLEVNGAQAVTSVAWSPDGQSLASAELTPAPGTPSIVTLWDVETWTVVGVLNGLSDYPLGSVSWSADGQLVAAVEGTCCVFEIRVWEVASRQLLHSLRAAYLAPTLMWSPTGPYLAAGAGSSPWRSAPLRIWDGVTAELLRELPGHLGNVHAVRWSADGQFLASASSDATVRVRGAPPVDRR